MRRTFHFYISLAMSGAAIFFAINRLGIQALLGAALAYLAYIAGVLGDLRYQITLLHVRDLLDHHDAGDGAP